MGTSESTQIVFRFAAKFFSGTLLSRISGMLRDIVLAFCFGTDPSLAAFMVAYRFAYLIRRLFGEGLLHQGFIPQFESLRIESPKKGAEFFRDIFWSFSILLVGVIFFGEIVMWILPKGDILNLSKLILPGIFFICLFGLTSALLHCEKHFFLSSSSGVFANLVWIGGVLAMRSLSTEQAIVGLTGVVFISFLFQWGVTLPKTYGFLRQSLDLKELFKPKLFSEPVRALKKPMLLGIVGVASIQVNSALDAVFARFADQEGPAYLWYAIRMQMLPLSLFGIALSSALLPSLSRAIKQGDEMRYKELMRFAWVRNFSLMFPCMVGIFVLGACSVNLLFGRGDFSNQATYETTICLINYGIGLVPYTFVQILAPAFYALGDYKTPARGFLYSTLINISLNSLLVFTWKFGAASVALATSLSACFNALFLFRRLKRKVWDREMGQPIARTALSALLAGGCVLVFGYYGLNDPMLGIYMGKSALFTRQFSQQILHFFAQAGLFFALFFSLCKLFKAEDVLELLRIKTYSSSNL